MSLIEVRKNMKIFMREFAEEGQAIAALFDPIVNDVDTLMKSVLGKDAEVTLSMFASGSVTTGERVKTTKPKGKYPVGIFMNYNMQRLAIYTDIFDSISDVKVSEVIAKIEHNIMAPSGLAAYIAFVQTKAYGTGLEPCDPNDFMGRAMAGDPEAMKSVKNFIKTMRDAADPDSDQPWKKSLGDEA